MTQEQVMWKSSIETIFPTTALALLRTNHGNRNLRKRVVEKYADAMKNGEWLLTPEPIVIAETGRLLNGQHRLNAVVQADIGVKMFVVRNVSENAFPAIDRGVSRNFADANSVERYLAETAKLLTYIRAGRSAALRDSEVNNDVEFLRENHEALLKHCNTMRKNFSIAAFRLAACIRMFEPNSREYVLTTYRNLVLGNVQDLPPIAQHMIGLLMAGKLKETNSDHLREAMLIRAFVIFNPHQGSLTRFPLITEKSLDHFMVKYLAAKESQNA